jgi:predicted dehydrogenase
MKVLIVGFGASGQRFAETLRSMNIPSLELWVYSRSRDMKLIQTDLQVFGVGDPITHYECNFLEDFSRVSSLDLDFAIIATTADSHFSYGMQLLSIGIPCVIEKPLALTVPEAAELTSLAEELKLPVHVCYQLSFHPMLEVIRNYSSAKHIGSPHFANFSYREKVSTMQPFRDEYSNHELVEEKSGGVAFSLSHEIFFITQVLTPGTSYSGVTRSTLYGGKTSATLQISADFSGDISNTSFPCHINLDLLTWPPNRVGAIHGDKGTLSWDWIGQTVKLESLETGIEFWDFSNVTRRDLQEKQMRYFIDLVQSPYQSNLNVISWLKTTEIAAELTSLPRYKG